MKRKGQLYSLIAVILVGIIMTSVVGFVYVSEKAREINAKHASTAEIYFSVEEFRHNIEDTFTKISRISVLLTTQYVVLHGFVNSAPDAIRSAVIYGEINGIDLGMPYTLEEWANSTIQNIQRQGLVIIPSTPDELLDRIEVQVVLLDAFTIYYKYKIRNITIMTPDGSVMYSGDLPSKDYFTVPVSIIGLEDPFLTRMAYGKYARFIIPAELTYVNERKYSPEEFDELLISKGYIATESGMSFFERLEGSLKNHEKYKAQSYALQDELGYQEHVPIGLVTIMVPDRRYDEELYYLLATYSKEIDDCSSVDYYFMRHYFRRAEKLPGYKVEGIGTDVVYLTEEQALKIFGTTSVLEK